MMFLEFRQDSHVDAWGDIFKAKLTAYHTCYNAVCLALPDMPQTDIRNITDELVYDSNSTFKRKFPEYDMDHYDIFMTDEELCDQINERIQESKSPTKVEITEV